MSNELTNHETESESICIIQLHMPHILLRTLEQQQQQQLRAYSGAHVCPNVRFVSFGSQFKKSNLKQYFPFQFIIIPSCRHSSTVDHVEALVRRTFLGQVRVEALVNHLNVVLESAFQAVDERALLPDTAVYCSEGCW